MIRNARKYAELGIQPNTDYTSVDDLPKPGSTKFIYLIPAEGAGSTGDDVYDEYIWVPDKNDYEHIGSTRIDLSNYAQINGNYQGMTVGAATKATQDGAGNVITDTYATKTEVGAKYTKPADGIPESDLAAEVQGKLINPEGTYESLTSGKAIADENGNNIADTYATKTSVNAKYTKPSSGIPESDLASAVQTSLGKANTALQSVPLATSSAVGGVKPVAKTDDMTQSVGVDASGALFTAPSGGTIEYMTNDEVDALFN